MDVDNLSLHFSKMSVCPHTFVNVLLDHDVLVILDAYHLELPSIFQCERPLHGISLKIDPHLNRSFFVRYPDQMTLYKELERILFQHVSTVFMMEMIPLIDEYIDFVWQFKTIS